MGPLFSLKATPRRNFCREDGEPLDPNRVSKLFDKYVKAAGVPVLSLHGVRHSYASLALAACVHPKTISQRLGHSTVSFTLDQYSHVLPGDEEAAAERVAAMMVG